MFREDEKKSQEDRVANIKSLEKQIMTLSRQVYRPYSAAVSALCIPTILSSLLLSKNSPLHPLYNNTRQYLLTYYSNDLREKYGKAEEIDLAQEHFEYLIRVTTEDYLHINLARYLYINNMSGEEKIQHMINDPIIDTPRGLHPEFKQLFINAHNMFVTARFDKNKVIPTLLMQDAPDTYSLKTLFTRTKNELNAYKEYFHITVKDINARLPKLLADTRIDTILTALQLSAAMLAQHILTNRIIRWRMPYNIGQEPIYYYMNNEDITIHENLLINYKDTLKSKARNSIITARIFSFIVCPLAAYLLFNIKKPPVELIAIAIGFAMTAVQNGIIDIKGFYHDYTLPSAIEEFKNNVNMLIDGHNNCITKLINEKNGSLSASQIKIIFKSPFKNIPPKKIVRLLINSLSHHGATFVSRKDSLIILAGDFVAVDNFYSKCKRKVRLQSSAEDPLVKIAKIQKTFKESLERYNEILKLKKQVNDFLKLSFPGIEPDIILFNALNAETSLPYITIEFNLPLLVYKSLEMQNENFSSVISDLFYPNAVSLKETDNHLSVMITGYSSVTTDKKLYDLGRSIATETNNLHNERVKKEKIAELAAQEEKSKAKQKASAKKSLTAGTKASTDTASTPASNPTNTAAIMTEFSGAAASKIPPKSTFKHTPKHTKAGDEKKNLHEDKQNARLLARYCPVQLGRFINTQSYMNTNHMIRNGISSAFFEKHKNPLAEKMINDFVLKASFTSHGTSPCLVKHEAWVDHYNNKEKQFLSSYKCRLIGNGPKGNIRFFTKEEKVIIQPNGKTLHLHAIKSIQFNSHKGR